MPKVRGPLFSLTASGTLSRILVYENRADSQRVRRLPQYQAPATPLQAIYQNKVAALSLSWKTWDNTNRQAWKTRAIAFNLTGYALFWREWYAQNITAPARPILP